MGEGNGGRSWSRVELSLACGLILLWLAFALHTTRGLLDLPPDAHQYLIVARSLVQGEGYTVPLVPFHAGYFDPVRHVPEMHGILRPLVLAALFAVGGVDASLARVPGMVYMAAAALVAFLFARRLFGPVAGLVACILTLTCLDLFKWAILGTDDVGFAFFFLSSVALLQRALRSGRDGDFLLAGAVAGLGVLEKPLGIFLPALFLAAALDWRRVGVTAVLRRGALLVVPFALCFAIYFLRNTASYGDPMFRLGALNWIQKFLGQDAAYGLYEVVPSLGRVVEGVGWRRVAEVAAQELASAGRMIFGLGFLIEPAPGPWLTHKALPPLLAALGLLGVGVHARRLPEFAALVACAILGAGAVTGLLWHVEPRYFLFLAPLYAVAVAGLVGGISRRAGLDASAVSVAWALGALALLATGTQLVHFADAAAKAERISRSVPPRPPSPCGGALDFLLRETEAQDRILTFDPWLVSWETGREAIMIPSGGVEPVFRVARHYGADWLLLQVSHRPRAPTIRTLRELTRRPGPLSLTREYAGEGCQVFRIGQMPEPGEAERSEHRP